MSAACKRLANLTISLFQSLRVEESFESFYNVFLNKMKELPFISEPKLPRKRCGPDYSIINHFSSSSNKQSNVHHPNTPRDYYKVIYYEALDYLITSLKERFDQPCFLKLMKVICHLVVELQMLKAICQNENFIYFEDVRQHMQNRPTENFILIPNVINIIKLVAVNPATSATAGRTFSLARNLKTWLQSTMLPARFNYLALLKFHQERTDNLNLLDVVNEFVSKKTRLSLFGPFTEKDF